MRTHYSSLNRLHAKLGNAQLVGCHQHVVASHIITLKLTKKDGRRKKNQQYSILCGIECVKSSDMLNCRGAAQQYKNIKYTHREKNHQEK